MEEGFFRRWARRKTAVRESGEQVAGADAVTQRAEEGAPRADVEPAGIANQASRIGEAGSTPTLADVARLTPGADVAPFLARNIDTSVRRAALKKLFADPHFNQMDGLDIYIDDYTKPSPLSGAMRAALQHARGILDEDEDDRRDTVGGRCGARSGIDHEAQSGAEGETAPAEAADAAPLAAAQSAPRPASPAVEYQYAGIDRVGPGAATPAASIQTPEKPD